MELGVGTGQDGVRRFKANCPHEAVEKGAQGRGWRMGKVNMDRTWAKSLRCRLRVPRTDRAWEQQIEKS